MGKVKVFKGAFCFIAIVIGAVIIMGVPFKCEAATSIYKGNSVGLAIIGLDPIGEPVSYGTNVKGVYFDGYPQLVKKEASKPIYKVKQQKDIMVRMPDGVHLAIDIYFPDPMGDKKFPVIISWGQHGKDAQEVTQWIPRQEYQPGTPYWDGFIEAGNINYVVTRGYVHVIPEPRGRGNSEGQSDSFGGNAPGDIYDVIDWIIKQPWCDGNVGMMGACAFAGAQFNTAALNPHPNLKAICPFENVQGTSDYFNGIFDCLLFNITTGRHGNDSGMAPLNTPLPPEMLSLPKEELGHRLNEALNDPDIKYNSKWYSLLRYPKRHPWCFDTLLEYFHPKPHPFPIHQVKIPAYMSTTWTWRLYIWSTFEAWENIKVRLRKTRNSSCGLQALLIGLLVSMLTRP